MKKLIPRVLLILFPILVFSQNHHLNIYLKNGSKVVYQIRDIKKLDFSGVTDIKDLRKSKNILEKFKLIQNYPNPFNPVTNIRYEIPKRSRVKIQIYDINGRLVRNCLDKIQDAGVHEISWNGITNSNTKAASGYYFYTVKFQNNIKSKKMILLK